MNPPRKLFLKCLEMPCTVLGSISSQFDRYRCFRYVENAVVLVLNTCSVQHLNQDDGFIT